MPPKPRRRVNTTGRAALMPRRRNRGARVIHANAKSIMDVTLNTDKFPLSAAAGGDINQAFAVSLSDIASGDLSAYQALYDEFKIRSFTYYLCPKGNQSIADRGLGFQIYHVLDNTDDNTLASPAAALEYATCKRSSSWKAYKRKINCYCPQLTHDVNNNPMITIVKPRWMQLAAQTIGGTSYDDTITAVIGAKFISDVNPSPVAQDFDLFIKLHVSFRTKK